MNVLMVDIGGSSVKTMVSDQEEMRKFPSGPTLTPKQMVAGVKAATRDWTFDAITVGFPGLVENGQLVREPLNLGGGWLAFDLARAFDRPVRIINDAALHALASYEGGRMLFVGFGTSIGAALVADDVIVPVELGLVPFTRRHKFMTRLTKQARKEYGHERWQTLGARGDGAAPGHLLAARHGHRRGQREASGSVARGRAASVQSGWHPGSPATLGRRRLSRGALWHHVAHQQGRRAAGHAARPAHRLVRTGQEAQPPPLAWLARAQPGRHARDAGAESLRVRRV